MFSQYFGNFLLNKGIITHGQLQEAIDLQRSTNLKLGVLAVNAGFMTVDQVEEIHRMQTRIDKRFGELAVDIGFITDAQVDELLSAQKKGHLLLGQALVDKGHLTLTQLQNELEEYKNQHSLSEEQFSALQLGNIEQIVNSFVSDTDNELLKDYLSLLMRNIIRFLDQEPRISIEDTAEILVPWTISQEIYGEINLFTGIYGTDEILCEIASKYAQENFEQFDEIAKDSIGEFLNLHNGIFLVNMSNKGVELGMHPQQVTQDKKLKQTNIAIHLPKGKFYLVVEEK